MKTARLFSAFAVVAVYFSAVSGQTIISGRAVNAGASPLSGVLATLIKQKVSDTTQADGVFQLALPASVAFAANAPISSGFSINGNRISFGCAGPMDIDVCLYSVAGRKVAAIAHQRFARGNYDIDLGGRFSGLSAGMYCLVLSLGSERVAARVLWTGGKIVSTAGSSGLSVEAGQFKREQSEAAADTLSLSKSGYVTRKIPITTLTAQNVGDVILQTTSAVDPIAVHNANEDQYDQIIIQSVVSHGLDTSAAMIIKAQIVIESGFNAQAISMYDTQLPCGSHSYGLLQVTPACETGFATLPSSTAVTATISGGLNGNPAVLTYANPADKTNGNTIVKENNIVIDLVSNSTNPLWSTSAFNPAYEIDFGVKAIASVMSQMKSKFSGCTAANYMDMALAGYNQGSNTVTGCTSYSANGQAYVNSVLSQYHTFCTQAGIAPVY